MDKPESFSELNIKEQFDTFFNEIYIEWDKIWVRKKEYLGTELYKVSGNIKAWKKFYTNSPITLLLYHPSDETIGYIGYKKVDDDLWMTELLIKESHQGKGFGKKIVNDFLSYLDNKNLNFKRILLETNSSSWTNKFYLSEGFILKEIIPNDRENGENTNVYCKEII